MRARVRTRYVPVCSGAAVPLSVTSPILRLHPNCVSGTSVGTSTLTSATQEPVRAIITVMPATRTAFSSSTAMVLLRQRLQFFGERLDLFLVLVQHGLTFFLS